MNTLRKTREKKSTSKDISYLVEKRGCLCPHGKFHPLIAGKGTYISAK